MKQNCKHFSKCRWPAIHGCKRVSIWSLKPKLQARNWGCALWNILKFWNLPESLFRIQNVESYSGITCWKQNELITQRFRTLISDHLLISSFTSLRSVMSLLSVSFSYSGRKECHCKIYCDCKTFCFADFAIFHVHFIRINSNLNIRKNSGF